MLPGPMCPASISSLCPFLARLPWSTCPLLLPAGLCSILSMPLSAPGAAALSPPSLTCPEHLCQWPVPSCTVHTVLHPTAKQAHVVVPLCQPLCLSFPYSTLRYFGFLLSRVPSCISTPWLCWFYSSFSSRKPPGTPLPTPLESCGSLGTAHCLFFLYKMSLCLC